MNRQLRTTWRVCTVLVCYYDDEVGEIVTKHLDSFDAPVVDSESLYKELVELFARLGLTWDNLLAILMDTCSVMRGSKTGLEKRIRDTVAPHLLDIDGDSCHHVHNVVKLFTIQFGLFVESLFRDIYRDFVSVENTVGNMLSFEFDIQSPRE